MLKETLTMFKTLFVVRAGCDIFKPDGAQNKPTTFSTKTRIGIKLKRLEKSPRSHQLTLIKVFSDLKNERD